MQKKYLLYGLALPLVLGLAYSATPTNEVKVTPTENETTTVKKELNLNTNIKYKDPSATEESFVIHYHRTSDTEYSKWGIHLWTSAGGSDWGSNPHKFSNTNVDSYGAWQIFPVTQYEANKDGGTNYIIHNGDSKDPGGDWKFVFEDYPLVDNMRHLYLFEGVSQQFKSAADALAPKIMKAAFENESTIIAETSLKAKKYEVLENGAVVANGVPTSTTIKVLKDNFKDGFVPSVSKKYELKAQMYDVLQSKDVDVIRNIDVFKLFNSPNFETEYNYDGELGAIYTNESTTFKVWAPTAESIKLRIYENGTPVALDSVNGSDTFTNYDMAKKEKGVWEYKLNGDQGGKYYTYVVTNSSYDNKEVVDPYAKSAGISGKRGMVVDFSKTNPEGWDDVKLPTFKETETVGYELHVADVTSSPTWSGKEENRKKFLGLIEEGTKYTSGETTVTTGFDHIKELGINAVQILPFYDQDNDEMNVRYNWGYNPLNYNVLEGAYSSNAHDGYARIKEFKQVSKKFNENGIKVIMDQVYNHVASLDNSNFNVLVPGYYFRYDAAGNAGNGSGCGNETASERYMFSKFMVESTEFWTSEYKISGFRFDLMGLHDIETMQKISDNLKEKNPASIVYGEPWSGGTSAASSSVTLGVQKNISKMNNVGAFNDQLRNSVKGGYGVSHGWSTMKADPGSAVTDQVKENLKGFVTTPALAVYQNPKQTVSYVTCHDNYTLHDQFLKYVDGKDDAKMYPMMNAQAQAFALTSQGIGFVHAGEELLRTKYDAVKDDVVENSYESSYEVNTIDYSRKITYPQLFKQYQTMIQLKIKYEGLHFETSEEVENALTLTSAKNNSWIQNKIVTDKTELLISYVSLYKAAQFDLTGYTILLDTSGKNKSGTVGEIDMVFPKSSVIIAYKGENPISEANNNNSNLTLIVSLSVGIGLPLLGLIGVGIYYFTTKKKDQ